MLVIRRIGERTIPYSWRASEQLRHFECDGFVGCVTLARWLVGCVIRVRQLNSGMRLTAWLLLRYIDGALTAAVLFSRPGSPMKEGRFDLVPSVPTMSILAISPKWSSSRGGYNWFILISHYHNLLLKVCTTTSV
ncbi:hypothetical protein TNCV_4432241 [Trichonephila clavipes]|nr:hypothetical protein TNCV_4432241 [Trichonephila clavipes]